MICSAGPEVLQKDCRKPDFILKNIASTISNIIRAADIFARVGGEEFAILLPSTNGKNACQLAKIIKDTIEKKTFTYESNEIYITMSFGIAELNSINTEKNLKELYNLADQRLYNSKNHGRNCITIDANIIR